MFKKTTIFITLLLITTGSCTTKKTNIQLAIQPLGRVTDTILHIVKTGIEKTYNIHVTILATRALPHMAYYKPRNRYRADALLSYLDIWTDKKYHKIVGITTRDISTTKGDIYDWGIFGLGQLDARPCVISTFRLKRNMQSRSHFYKRLLKVVNHEIAHTFGLDHCPNKNCLMQDARGTIKTVDRESGIFCRKCRNRLHKILIK